MSARRSWPPRRRRWSAPSTRHYEAAGAQAVHERLETLFDHVLKSINTRNLGTVLAMRSTWPKSGLRRLRLSKDTARFNALEEATWARTLAVWDSVAVRRGYWAW